MTADINKIIDELIGREGKYVNDPSDAGGETNWGITVKVARGNGYLAPMKDMPRTTAHAIYLNEYWMKPGLPAVNALFPILARKLLDIGVNCGTSFASITLQRCLNVLNDGGKLYPDLKVDGDVGPTTIRALDAYLKRRTGDMGRRTLLFMVAAQQSNRYLEIAESKSSQERFMYGWQSQRALYDAIL